MAERLVILGAGGHAKMVIEAARSQGEFEPAVCLAQGALPKQRILDVPVEDESIDLLRELKADGFHAFVAIGSNKLRRKLTNTLVEIGLPIATIIAKNAWKSPSARIEDGCVLMPGAIVGADASIGAGAIINTAASVDHDCSIGAFAHIAPGTHLAGNVHIGEAAFLGVGVSVIPERKIGSHSTIGAGGVVVCDIPNDEVWVGCPARMLKRLT